MKLKILIYGFIFLILAVSCNEPVIEPQPLTQEQPVTASLKSGTIGTIYYVAKTGNDNNTGTETSPFLTIQKAANVVKPGETVIVKDGTYTTTGEYVLTMYNSGTAGNYITIKAEHKGGAIIDGRSNATPYGMEFTKVAYVKLEDFEFKDISLLAILISGSNNIIISGNNIHDIGKICSDSDYGIVGIHTAKSTSITIKNNRLYNIGRFANGENGCTTTNNYWMNHDHALYIDGVNGLTVNNNIIYNIKAGWGIHLYSSAGSVSTNVSILNNTWANKNDNKNGQILICGSVGDLLIANNIFYLPTAVGVNISSSFVYSNCSIKNNITYGGTVSSGTFAGFTCTNNLDNTDPKLLNPGAYVYTLQAGSPAINAGIDMGILSDYSGNTIVGLPDIGAYESLVQVIPPTVYYNAAISATATKNSCGTGYTGSTVTYTVSANKYSSTVSQADADSKATADLNNNKQSYANANGSCTPIPPTVYYSSQTSASAVRSDCGSGYTGTTVVYTVTSGKYNSLVSQADADSKAQADLTANKQAYADANGYCTPKYVHNRKR